MEYFSLSSNSELERLTSDDGRKLASGFYVFYHGDDDDGGKSYQARVKVNTKKRTTIGLVRNIFWLDTK